MKHANKNQSSPLLNKSISIHYLSAICMRIYKTARWWQTSQNNIPKIPLSPQQGACNAHEQGWLKLSRRSQAWRFRITHVPSSSSSKSSQPRTKLSSVPFNTYPVKRNDEASTASAVLEDWNREASLELVVIVLLDSFLVLVPLPLEDCAVDVDDLDFVRRRILQYDDLIFCVMNSSFLP